MIKIWQLIWHGCWHDWVYLGKGKLQWRGEPYGEYARYKCSKCSRLEDRTI